MYDLYSVSLLLKYFFEDNFEMEEKKISNYDSMYIGIHVHNVIANNMKGIDTDTSKFYLKELINILSIQLLSTLKKSFPDLSRIIVEKDLCYRGLVGRFDFIATTKSLPTNFTYPIYKYFYDADIFVEPIIDRIKDKEYTFLIDWKCSQRNIFLKRAYIYNGKQYFDSCDYVKYTLQLNFYRYLSKKNGLDVSVLYLFLVKPSDSSVKVYRVPVLKDEYLEKIINIFEVSENFKSLVPYKNQMCVKKDNFIHTMSRKIQEIQC